MYFEITSKSVISISYETLESYKESLLEVDSILHLVDPEDRIFIRYNLFDDSTQNVYILQRLKGNHIISFKTSNYQRYICWKHICFHKLIPYSAIELEKFYYGNGQMSVLVYQSPNNHFFIETNDKDKNSAISEADVDFNKNCDSDLVSFKQTLTS